ncbi:hypothetical protein FRC03_012088 [Tulasnella sp. 419]|nr:hypothetical protein FRC02_006651 [Tulasnella sp. 418]KAG8966385.1 hypothetical protein FRC03_012088 [Tulasnella sp. 419]
MNVVLGHPDFFSSLLPELPADSDFSKSCLKRLSSDLWSEKTRRFEFTSSEQEKDMYGPLVDTLNAILEFRVTESASITSSSMPHPTSSASLDSWTPPRYEFVRVDQDFANRKVLPACAKGEPYYNCRPDIAMVLRNAPDSPTSWYDVALSIEVMRDPKKLAAEQAEDQADAILTNAPTKRFLYSFILCDSSLEICLCDRGGVITSERIDVNVNPHLFIEVVRQFASMSPVDLGFDETTIELPAGVGYPVDRGPIGSPIVSIQGEIYYRIQTLSGSSSSFGRSTRCFEARRLIKSKGTWSNETYLLKYFWNDVKRQPDEGKIYERIKKEGVKVGVAEFVSFVRLSKLSTIRRGLPLLNDYGDSDMEEYKMEGDEEQEDEGEEDEREQGSGEEDEGEEDKREQDEDEETTETEVELAGDRQLCVLVLASVGKSLSTPTTIYELISATKSAIKGKLIWYLNLHMAHVYRRSQGNI